MKRWKLIKPLFVASAFIAASCSMPPRLAHRDEINREMPLLVRYETKRNHIKRAIGVLSYNGIIDNETGREVKESMDIEHVYYEASLISLAKGEMEEYRAYVTLAEKELERSKSALTTRMQALQTR